MSSILEDLPPSDSPKLALSEQSPEEKVAIWKSNGQVWRGRLSMESYIRREDFLANQELTRNGGITFWILTDSTKPPNQRPILSSCESVRKRAFVRKADGIVEEVISHGIASVFCDPKLRGRGYANRMVVELGKKLDYWSQKEGKQADFTVLYSDIGKVERVLNYLYKRHGVLTKVQKFYSRSGWQPFTSGHISLRPINPADTVDTNLVIKTRELFTQDLDELCRQDEQMLHEALTRSSSMTTKTLVAFIPDVATMSWHHAREEFFGQEVLGRVPTVKGAYAQCSNGNRVWAIWSRFFGNQSTKGNVLNVLRMIVESEESITSLASGGVTYNVTSPNPNEEQVRAVTAVLQAAQAEAGLWGMNDIQLWNPSPTVVAAARSIEPASLIIHRDEDSIASLRWHSGDPKAATSVGWVQNEKYGWC